jgi:Leucine-rich repeat (LRR) protein
MTMVTKMGETIKEQQSVDDDSNTSDDDDIPLNILKTESDNDDTNEIDDRSNSDEIVVTNAGDDDDDDDSDAADVIDESKEDDGTKESKEDETTEGSKKVTVQLLKISQPKYRSNDAVEICNEIDTESPCECYYDIDHQRGEKLATIDCVNETLTSANIRTTYMPAEFKADRILLAGNGIRTLKKNAIASKHINSARYLDLSANLIDRIWDGAFNGMLSLQTLTLNDNRLEHIDRRVFSESDGVQLSLHTLSLTNNRITYIDDEAFVDVTHLETLLLDGNDGLTLTTHTFGAQHSLHTLSLRHCGLTSLPDGVFSELRQLRRLSLAGNPLISISPAVNVLHSLQMLDVSATGLHRIGKRAFEGMTSLQQLIAEDMPELTTLDDCALCGLSTLTTVSFANSTALDDVHANAFGRAGVEIDAADQLTSIDFSGCHLRSVDAQLYSWHRVDELRFDRNPLHCDTHLYWMAVEYRKLTAVRPMIRVPRCLTPMSLYGRRVDELKVTDLVRLSTFAVAAFAGTALALVLVALVGVVACVCCRRCHAFQSPEMPYDQFVLLLDDSGSMGGGHCNHALDDGEHKSALPPPVEV